MLSTTHVSAQAKNMQRTCRQARQWQRIGLIVLDLHTYCPPSHSRPHHAGFKFRCLTSASNNVTRDFLGDPDAKTKLGARKTAVIEPPAAEILAVSMVNVAVVMILAL